jgi:hypothetical protein
MRHTILASALALSFTVTGAAFAQTAVTSTTTKTVELSPEQRTVVQEYVVRDHRPSVAVQGFEVRTGAVLPPSVAFYDVPKVERYRYTIVNDRRVIVDPATRQVVEVIQ